MVAADGDTVAAGEGARQPHAAVERVGAVLAELDHVGPLDDRQELLRALDLDAGRAREVGAHGQCALSGFQDRRKCMAERDRAQSHAVFDELVAVDVPDVAAETALHDAGHVIGKLIGPLGIGMATPRDQCLGPLREPVALVEALAQFGRRDRLGV